VGLEAALNRVGVPNVLFLPLGFDATPGYEAGTQADLKSTIASALQVLWNNCAIARDAAGAPDTGRRQLWLVGHSSGNRSTWDALLSNAADVGRVISFDATPKNDNLSRGINAMKTAAAARKRRQLTLEAFVITTPNMTNDNRWGLDDQTDLELRATGASVTVLPDFAERSSYWQLPPTSSTNPYLRYLLAKWTDAELAASAKRPNRWNFLFFHELAVFGGHHIAPQTTPPILRTFFQDAVVGPSAFQKGKPGALVLWDGLASLRHTFNLGFALGPACRVIEVAAVGRTGKPPWFSGEIPVTGSSATS
jgi:hypothetical protein